MPAGPVVNGSFLVVLGRDAPLSLAELVILNRANRTPWTLHAHWKNACLLLGALDPFELQERVGGTVKIAHVLGSLSTLDQAALDQLFLPIFSNLEPRFYYGFSFFGNVSSKEQKFFQAYFKTAFKENHVKAMYKAPKTHGEPNQNSIHPSEIFSRGLLDTGFDFCIAKKNNTIYVGRTITASNAKAISKRDKERVLQNKVSAISIRLARILVNLTGLSPTQTLLDPFCGVGTILQEARLVGLNAVGVDQDPDAIKAARQNLKYLKNGPGQTELVNADATHLSRHPLSFDGVATEPTLGPYLTRLPSVNTARQTLAELEEIFDGLFRALSHKMKKGQPVVIILPEFPTIEGKLLRFSEKLFEKHGFVSTNPLSFPEYARVFPYLYTSDTNKIHRLIYLLEKRKGIP